MIHVQNSTGVISMDWNNFMLQLSYKEPFNKEEQAYYEHLCQGLDRQLSQTVEWLQSSQAEEFYRERAEYLEGLWQQYDLDSQLDNVINYNASSCDGFMDNFYHSGAMIGYQQLKRGLAYTPADERTLNFIRQTNYGFVKSLNNDVKNGIRRTIFEDIAKGNSYQKTINKLRKLPLEPVANGKLSPDVRARFIARTERARARGYGTIQSYLNYGVQAYELITGKGACNICIDLEGNNPYPIQDSKAYVPIHPNCRCSNAPYIDEKYPLSDAPLDYPLSVTDYIDATMTNVTERPKIQSPIKPSTSQPKSYSINHENSFSDVKITKSQFDNVVAHQSKRANAKFEFGNSIDNQTGKLNHNKDIRGKKNTVRVPTSNREYSVIHNHTNNGGFSGGDAYSHLTGSKQRVCYATTPKGIWIMRDTAQATFSKKQLGITDNAAYEIQNRMNGKFREFSNESKTKYQKVYDNAKTPQQKEEIRQQLNNEVFENYNNWLLDEFAVGKRRDWLIEIEFIPKETIPYVKF